MRHLCVAALISPARPLSAGRGQPRRDGFERQAGAGIVLHCFSLLSLPGLRTPGARFSRILRGFHAPPCVPRIVNSLLLTMERTLGAARFFSASRNGQAGSPDVKVPMEQRVRAITGGAPHPLWRAVREGWKSWLAAPAVVYKPVNLENLARTWA